MKSSPAPNIKLVMSLCLLSKKEMKSFIEFAGSKYFSGDRNYAKTLTCLQKYHAKGFSGISNSELLSQLSEDLGIGTRSLLNRLSELYQIFEKFLLMEHFQKDSSDKFKLLLKILYNKKSLKLFDYVADKSRKYNELSGMDSDTLNDLLMTRHLEMFAAFERRNYGKFRKLSSSQSLYHTAHYLISMFVDSSEQLQQTISGISTSRSYSQILLEKIDVETFLKYLKDENEFLFNYVTLYKSLHDSFHDSSDLKSFANARKIHNTIAGKLTRAENQAIYLSMITYSINQLVAGKREFNRILFGIIEEKLNAGYYEELMLDNYPVNNFRDYVIIALGEGKVDWVKDFVEKYSPMLPDSYREDEIRISLARIAQFENRFYDALKHIEKVRRRNYLHYTDTLAISIRSHLELENTEKTYLVIERLKQYLNYHKEIPLQVLKDYREFIKDVILLIRYSEGILSKTDLKYKLRNRSMKKARPWIAEKFSELLK